MNFDRLNTFLTAARDLNFTQAARRLQLSQPAVSQQMRELEDELGVELFARRGRGLLLTPAGERLQELALPILREVKQVETEMATYHEVPQGVLHVGASNTLGIYLLPFALGEFSAAHPGIRVSLQVGETSEIARGLNDGDMDLALVEHDPSRLQGWDKVALLEDELVLIAPPDHPWAQRGSIALDDLPDGDFIFRTRQSETRGLINNRLSEAGLDPARLVTRFELGHTEGIKRSVMAGLGVGFVSNFATSVERRSGLLVEVPIRDFRITRTLWLLRPITSRLMPHQESFCELLLGGGWLPDSLLRSA